MLIKIGDIAPDFSLPTDRNGAVRLSDFKGKKVIVYFYPKDLTPGCTQEACDFRDNKESFDKYNIIIIGISKDGIKSHSKFRQNENLNFILASDEDTQVAKNYGVWVEKSLYGKKYMGMERATFLIDETGKVQRIWRNVKVNGHVSEILNTIVNKS